MGSSRARRTTLVSPGPVSSRSCTSSPVTMILSLMAFPYTISGFDF
jgi:hypothetical protein